MSIPVMQPYHIEDWLEMVPHLTLESGWNSYMDDGHSNLCHCECPWGGELLRIRAEVHVEQLLEKPSDLLVRPEVRAYFGNGDRFKLDSLMMFQHHSPGEALLQQLGDAFGFGTLLSCFLEASDDPTICESRMLTKTSWQKLSRDFPEVGDTSLSFRGDSVGLLLCQPLDLPSNRFLVNGFFDMSEEQFLSWTSIHLRLLFETARRTAQWFVNRPGISELREHDKNYYTILTVQSCRRGLPFLPLGQMKVQDQVVTITDGEKDGLVRWIRYNPQSYGKERFHLSDYLQVFMAVLGIQPNFQAYKCLDGGNLVSFQCVVASHDWSLVKDRFYSAFLMQRKAYRRGNGGSTAPSIREGDKPRFLQEERKLELAEQYLTRKEAESSQHKVVVQRTFVHVNQSESGPRAPRSTRKHRTTSICLASKDDLMNL